MVAEEPLYIASNLVAPGGVVEVALATGWVRKRPYLSAGSCILATPTLSPSVLIIPNLYDPQAGVRAGRLRVILVSRVP